MGSIDEGSVSAFDVSDTHCIIGEIQEALDINIVPFALILEV